MEPWGSLSRRTSIRKGRMSASERSMLIIGAISFLRAPGYDRLLSWGEE